MHPTTRRTPRALPARARDLLDRLSVRVLLSVAIVISLLPLSLVGHLNNAFLVLFGVELSIRIVAFFAPPRPQDRDVAPGRRRASALALLALDFVALLSFVPWTVATQYLGLLRLVRLSRMLLLIGYWGPLVRDVRTVLGRRERARQVTLMGFAVAIISFTGAVVLENMPTTPDDVFSDYDGDGRSTANDTRFLVRLWWAFRQVQDPGNMMQSPDSVSGVVVSLGLTLAGLFLVSFLIGLGTDVVRELLELSRNRPQGLTAHSVVVHVTPITSRLLRELVRYYQKLFTTPKAALLGHLSERPAFLGQDGLGHITYRHGHAGDPAALARVDHRTAKRVVLLADPSAPDPDAHTTGLILTLREANPRAWLVAEIVDPANIEAARVAGQSKTTVVPVERLMGLVLSAAVARPGISSLLRELLSSAGHEVYSYFYAHPDLDGVGTPLHPHEEARFDALLEAGLSLPESHPVVVLGVIGPDPTAPADPYAFQVRLGSPPPPDDSLPHPILGLVALGESFKAVEKFASEVKREWVDPPTPPCGHPQPRFIDPVERRPKRLLMCGFRPAVIPLCGAMMTRWPDIEIQLMVEDDAAAAEVAATVRSLQTQAAMGRCRLWGVEGWLESVDAGLGWRSPGTEHPVGHLRVTVGDWTTDRDLCALPETGDSVGAMDVVVLAGGPRPEDDARTAMSVLKIADLRRLDPGAFCDHFEVVAVVVEEELGRLLEERFMRVLDPTGEREDGALGGIRVFSTREFGAYFVFQSVVVPGFDHIYTELLGPGGQDLHCYRVETAPDDTALWSFIDLSRVLRARGESLVGAWIRVDGEPILCVAPSPDDPGGIFAPTDLLSVWVVRPDRG